MYLYPFLPILDMMYIKKQFLKGTNLRYIYGGR